MWLFCLGEGTLRGNISRTFHMLEDCQTEKSSQLSVPKESRTSDERFRAGTSKSSAMFRQPGSAISWEKEGCGVCGSVSTTGLQNSWNLLGMPGKAHSAPGRSALETLTGVLIQGRFACHSESVL